MKNKAGNPSKGLTQELQQHIIQSCKHVTHPFEMTTKTFTSTLSPHLTSFDEHMQKKILQWHKNGREMLGKSKATMSQGAEQLNKRMKEFNSPEPK
jgi:hypothetical protein